MQVILPYQRWRRLHERGDPRDPAEQAKMKKENQGRVLEERVIIFEQEEDVHIDAAGQAYDQRAAATVDSLHHDISQIVTSATQNALEGVSPHGSGGSRRTEEAGPSASVLDELQTVCRTLSNQVQQCNSQQYIGRQRQLPCVIEHVPSTDLPSTPSPGVSCGACLTLRELSGAMMTRMSFFL